MWQFYHHSLVLFPRQLLAEAVVIVYGFGRHFALPLFLFFFFSDCMCWRGVGGLLCPYIYPSIDPSIASIVLFSFFFLLFLFCYIQWKLTREIRNDGKNDENDDDDTPSFPVFLHGFFFFLLSVQENASTYFVSRISFSENIKKNRRERKKETEHESTDVALSFWIKMWEANKVHSSICLSVLFLFRYSSR